MPVPYRVRLDDRRTDFTDAKIDPVLFDESVSTLPYRARTVFRRRSFYGRIASVRSAPRPCILISINYGIKINPRPTTV